MTEKTLADYMLLVRKDYKYTVRIATAELPDKIVDRIEQNLKEYELVNITSPKKTIWQTSAIGFTDPVFSEVFIFDVTLGLPASCFWLGRQIAQIVKVSEARVVVNGEDNPLVVDAEKVDASKLYGTDYNEKMMKTIGDAKAKDHDSIVQTAKKK